MDDKERRPSKSNSLKENKKYPYKKSRKRGSGTQAAIKCDGCGKITYGKWRTKGWIYCYNCYQKNTTQVGTLGFKRKSATHITQVTDVTDVAK